MKRYVLNREQSRLWRPLKSLLAAAAIGLGCVQAQADTLWEVYQQALDNDPQLAADRAAYRAGLEEKNLGRAGLLPQINASAVASENRADNSLIQLFPVNGTTTEFQNSSHNTTDGRTYSATLTQPLFNAAAWFGYQEGKLSSEQAAAKFSADQQSMMIRVATGYFDVLRGADDLETARAEEQALAKQLEQTQQRFEVGLTAITDVYDSRAAHDSATASLLDAQDTLLSSFDALSVLTGLQHETIAPLVSDFTVAPPVPADRSAWVAFALSNNFTLRAARLNADAARYTARARASDHLPTLSGGLSYRKNTSYGRSNGKRFGEDTNSPVDSNDVTKTASITLNVPIYTGGRTSASRRQSRNLAFQVEDQRNLTERNTIQNTRTLHRSVVTDVSRVKARQQAIVSSSSALDATKAGYEVGTRNLVDVLLAQRTLYQARRDYSASLYSYILNTLNLQQAAGLLAPNDLQQLETKLNPGASISRTIASDAGAAK